MKNLILITLLFLSCQQTKDSPANDVVLYFECINRAEVSLCQNDFTQADKFYELAFKLTDKPFGKDVFNAALVNGLLKDEQKLHTNLQTIINNSDELGFVESTFIDQYISKENWDKLIQNRQIAYDELLRKEFKEILARDQLFRPQYDTHDDTINVNRKINLTRIIALTEASGFPSHHELGYTEYLTRQNHYIVLHHTAQRRSKDGSVMDLEPLLKKAIEIGRFDPELAIFYMNFQNDVEKGRFEVYSTWQYYHPLLPDSLNKKIWLPKLDAQQISEANRIRKEWHANTLGEVAMKTFFLTTTDLPFRFTGVHKSTANFSEDMDKAAALEQYKGVTSFMEVYQN